MNFNKPTLVFLLLLTKKNFVEIISIYLVFILLYWDSLAISSLVSKNTIISNNIKNIEVIMKDMARRIEEKLLHPLIKKQQDKNQIIWQSFYVHL
jgi:hypothetical protein